MKQRLQKLLLQNYVAWIQGLSFVNSNVAVLSYFNGQISMEVFPKEWNQKDLF